MMIGVEYLCPSFCDEEHPYTVTVFWGVEDILAGDGNGEVVINDYCNSFDDVSIKTEIEDIEALF
jgi:hypothetical protein